MLDLVASPRREFGQAKRDTLPSYCLECEVRFALPPRLPQGPGLRPPPTANPVCTPYAPGTLHYLCPRYKAFFGHIRPATAAICQLLRAGRAPSELVSQCAAEHSRRGRNDPCPCGSGRKWKRCHQLTPRG